MQDDSNGSGPYIKEWNIDGVAKPTDTQLDDLDSAADLEERQNAVRATSIPSVALFFNSGPLWIWIRYFDIFKFSFY